MDLLCIDGNFSAEQRAFYDQHGIVTPLKDVMYSPRSISRNSNGDWEILLNEIINKEVPIKHKILGSALKEPAWKVSRFRNLDQSELTQEQIKEIKQLV